MPIEEDSDPSVSSAFTRRTVTEYEYSVGFNPVTVIDVLPLPPSNSLVTPPVRVAVTMYRSDNPSVGGKIKLYLTSDLGFGDSGQVLAPGVLTIFDVEILEVKEPTKQPEASEAKK